MTPLEAYERLHASCFTEFEKLGPPKNTAIRTPDGREWKMSEIVVGWQPRPSDLYGWHLLHLWVAKGDVDVQSIELPCPLMSATDRDDPVRQFIERKFGPDAGPVELPMGAVDFAANGLYVEFGTVAPAKFAINVGMCLGDHMVVPYESAWGFVFIPRRLLLKQ